MWARSWWAGSNSRKDDSVQDAMKAEHLLIASLVVGRFVQHYL
jgi:hypothetical protein